MTNLRLIFVLLALFVSPSVSAAPASEYLIRQVLEITKARGILDNMRNQINEQFRRDTQEILKANNWNDEKRETFLKAIRKMQSLSLGEYTWEKWEPRYISVYREVYTEEDVIGMLNFYRTPAGQALINKLPVLTLRMTNLMTEVDRGLKEEIGRIQEEVAFEMKKENK